MTILLNAFLVEAKVTDNTLKYIFITITLILWKNVLHILFFLCKRKLFEDVKLSNLYNRNHFTFATHSIVAAS